MPTSGITITVTGINVPPLSDNSVAFLNAEAWNNYWLNSNFTITVPLAQAETEPYNPSVFQPVEFITEQLDLNGSGNLVPYNIPLFDSYNFLVAAVIGLQANYVNLKNALIAANIITGPTFVPATINPTQFITQELDLTGSGNLVQYSMPLLASYNEVNNAFQALQTDYVAFKQQLISANIITE